MVFWKSVHDHHQRGRRRRRRRRRRRHGRGAGVCATERERCGLRMVRVTQENPTLAYCPEFREVRQQNSPHFRDSCGTFLE